MKLIKTNNYYFPGMVLFWMCLVAYNLNITLKTDKNRERSLENYVKAMELYRQADSLLRADDSVRKMIDSIIDNYKK